MPYYHRDALGSITEVSDSTGAIVERYEYDVYGEFTIYDASDTEIVASAIGNPYLFTARRYDAESGNYYYRARYYSHALGRFLSQDPLGFGAGDYNLYRYVFNNPTLYTDPTGEIVPLILLGVAVALTIADYAFTAWDVYNAAKILADDCANDVDKLVAGFEIALAGIFELLEPDEFLPINLPADDIARRALMREVKEAAAEGGIEGFERAVRDKLGDETADRVFKEMGLDDLVGTCLIGKNSFSADTEVATEEGKQAISTLEIGDMVLAYNEATGEIDYYPVVATISHEDPVVQYLTIDDETIITTANHPFYTTAGEWITAGELQIGDTILRANGEYGTITATTHDYQPQYMYNLTVDTAHTYFVGDGEWLVHNTVICVANMKEFFNKTDYGKSISGISSRTNRTFQGQSIYKVSSSSGQLRKGDHFYLDNLHKDHLEVFNNNGAFKIVLNLDGTVNNAKTAAAAAEGRSITSILR